MMKEKPEDSNSTPTVLDLISERTGGESLHLFLTGRSRRPCWGGRDHLTCGCRLVCFVHHCVNFMKTVHFQRFFFFDFGSD